MKNKTVLFIVIFIAVSVIGLGIGYYLYQKPVKNFAESEAEVIIQAAELYNKFVSNEAKAISEFVSEDKTIKVKGKVLDVEENPDGQAVVFLDVNDPDGDISCTIIEADSPGAVEYMSGDEITIQGQCTGYQELINKEVIMIRCGIK